MSTTASALLNELEDLRKVLDSKSPLGATPSIANPSLVPQLGTTPLDISREVRSPPPRSRTAPVFPPPTPGTDYLVDNHTLSGYTAALSDAEANVDRLSRAMEAAEEEMENTFKRTTELHRSTAERREAEILELRKILAAKERSMDSLRETLTSTKRSLEARAAQAEQTAASAQADVQRLLQEVRRLKQENVSSKQESVAMQGELGGIKAAIQGVEVQKHQREEELRTTQRRHREEIEKLMSEHTHERSSLQSQVHHLQAEYSTLQSQLQHEVATRDMKLDTASSEVDASKQEAQGLKHEVDNIRHQAEAARRELEAATRALDHAHEELRAEQEMRREAQHRLELEKKKRKMQKEECQKCDSRVHDIALETKLRTSELEKKLKEEQRTRMGAEKWLQAEMKAKEELEMMVGNLRDMVLKKESTAEIAELRTAVMALQGSKQKHKEKCRHLRHYDCQLRTSLERENERLREELGSAQRHLTRKLYAEPKVDRDDIGDLLARCRRCHQQFNLSKPPENACGYHPGDLTAHGFACCGVIPKAGSTPVYCHWRPHVA